MAGVPNTGVPGTGVPGTSVPDDGAAAPGRSTLPQLLLARADSTPDADALRRKRFGIWHATTWRALADQVEAVATGLRSAGVDAGDVVAVLSDNRPEWLVVELAAQSLQAAVVGLHPDASGEQVAALLAPLAVRTLVVEDGRQLAKVADVTGDLPSLTTVVCLESRGVVLPQAPSVTVRLMTDLEAEGRAAVTAEPGAWRARVLAGGDTDVAVLCQPERPSATPAELAAPRTAGLTHRNLLAASTAFTSATPTPAKTRYVSVLPLAWSWEQVAGVTGSLRHGFALSFPESPSTQRADLRDIGPDVLLAPARLWEDMAEELLAAVSEGGRARHATWRWAHARGVQHVRDGSSSPAWRVADTVVLRAVRDRLGMTRLKQAHAFGGPLRPDVALLFRAIGVDLRQLYGATDAGGPVTAQPARRTGVDEGDVGTALAGVEVRLAPDGEVLIRSEAVPPRPAAAALDAEGWLHTGDRGQLAGDRLVVTDRIADLLVVGGAEVGPALLESHLRASAYVEDAVVVPLGQPATGLGVLVVVDPRTAGGWAEEHRRHAATYADLVALPELAELVGQEVARLLQDRPGGALVSRCVLAHRRLDVALDELTRTRVVRRHVVAAHFAPELAALEGHADPAGPAALVVEVPRTSVPVEQGART